MIPRYHFRGGSIIFLSRKIPSLSRRLIRDLTSTAATQGTA